MGHTSTASRSLKQVTWKEWPQFNFLYFVDGWSRTMHVFRSQHTLLSGSLPRKEYPIGSER